MRAIGGVMSEREHLRIFDLPHDREEGWDYFNIDRSKVNMEGKALMTKVGYIPAGTLLWSENSLIEDFRKWRKEPTLKEKVEIENVVTKRGRETTKIVRVVTEKEEAETKNAYHARVQKLWDGFGEEQKTIFTNFPWDEDEGDGKIDFAADDMESRIQANAGADVHSDDMLCAYAYLNFISHSCRPNCRLVDRGRDTARGRWQLRTLIPILAKGIELTVDYADFPQGPKDVMTADSIKKVTVSVKDRKAHIDKHYGFNCECEACTDSTTNETRKQIRNLYRQLMTDRLPASNTNPTDNEQWEAWAAELDHDMNKYILLLKSQHLFPMALLAHHRAHKVYSNAQRESDGTAVNSHIIRSDSAKEREHLFGLIEMRRLLYGAWDPDSKGSSRRTYFLIITMDELRVMNPTCFLHVLNQITLHLKWSTRCSKQSK
jgi:hypothetical protein